MIRVMVIDDSKTVREIISRLVVDLGHLIVAQANNGFDGYKKYKELRPDLVFLDISMPKINGVQTLKKIVEFDSGAKVIMATSHGEDIYVNECIKSGAKGYILKPLKFEKVQESIIKLFPDIHT